jgi:hypothetical protein
VFLNKTEKPPVLFGGLVHLARRDLRRSPDLPNHCTHFQGPWVIDAISPIDEMLRFVQQHRVLGKAVQEDGALVVIVA